MAAMPVYAHVCCTRLNPTQHIHYSRTQTHYINFMNIHHNIHTTEMKHLSFPFLFNYSTSRFRNFQNGNAETSEPASSPDTPEAQTNIIGQNVNQENKNTGRGFSFLAKLVIVLGVAATFTLISAGFKQSWYGSSHGVEYMTNGSSTSLSGTSSVGFTFNVFGKTVVLPQYPPGWVYFWLLMAAGCGLFISEEALNIWVGISLSKLLSWDGTWSSFIASFSRNGPYIISTVLWVYWGVCISDMVPFYLGKLFRQSGGSDDVYSRLGIGKDKATNITRVVQRYGNLIGFVERFSLGVRNPTGFLAGALDILPEYYFAGVCCGCLITLPLQLGIGFLLRERPVFAVATVASVMGIWTLFPYAIAALTGFFIYMRSRLSS